MMQTVRVELFAAAREAAGSTSVMVTMSLPTTVTLLQAAIRDQYPHLQSILSISRMAIDLEFANDEDVVLFGQAVALIPPVSGG